MKNIDEKIQAMCDLPETGEHYICQSVKYDGMMTTDILNFDEMRTWLVKREAEVPQRMIKVVNERTGKKI